jgi:nitrogen fixation/metabolism regulation signal transduction histidine kinase
VTQVLRYALVIGSAIGAILLFLLASASDNSGFFDRNYSWLLGLSAAVAGVLLILVIVALTRLYARYKAGKFGSRLMTRLMLMFAGIGIVPGLVIFMVSVQFVSHSIDSWFDVKIEAALDSGLNLGKAAIDESLSQLGVTANTAAATLAGQDTTSARVILTRVIGDETGMQSAVLLSAEGQVLATAAEDPQADLKPDLPTPQMLKRAALPGGYAQSEGSAEREFRDFQNGGAPNGLDMATGLRQRVVVAVPEPPGTAPRYLQLMQAVPVNLASNAQVLQEAYSTYQSRDFSRRGLRKMYIETLTLTLLLAIFSAIGSAFLIAGNLAQPLLVLAEGTRAVAEGDLSPRPIVETNDELGTLTQSFNAMTGQLFEARSAVERNRSALESAKAHLESVLANMSAGVIVMDAEGVVVNSNDAVHRILQVDASALAGRPLDAIEGMEVFDDISDVISAQRSVAWGEVARRLAHEIKNPLTPIQLSAERMQMKLADRLDPQGAELLKKGTDTIVNQVDAMKRMVDDFRDYAKAPPAVLDPLDLNELISQILNLYLSEDESDVIHAALAPNLPRVMGDATQLRQVIHNLLQNAQDALADAPPGNEPPRIDLVTEAIHYEGAGAAAGTAVRLAIVDNGPGFAPKILSRAFEPYVTSKVRGTGLGLPMVKKIVDEHGGRIDVANRADGSGASVSILLLKLAPEANLAEV